MIILKDFQAIYITPFLWGQLVEIYYFLLGVSCFSNLCDPYSLANVSGHLKGRHLLAFEHSFCVLNPFSVKSLD